MSEIKIRLDAYEINSLYDLGYLSIDIFQLIVFCELLEERNFEQLDRMYYNPTTPFAKNRYADVFVKYRDRAKVLHLQDGSMELVVSVTSAISGIVLPFVAIYVQEQIRKNNERITFEINTKDSEVINLLEGVRAGHYGLNDTQWFEYIQNTLVNKGYSVELIGKDCYRVIKQFGVRIAKTMDIPKRIRY